MLPRCVSPRHDRVLNRNHQSPVNKLMYVFMTNWGQCIEYIAVKSNVTNKSVQLFSVQFSLWLHHFTTVWYHHQPHPNMLGHYPTHVDTAKKTMIGYLFRGYYYYPLTCSARLNKAWKGLHHCYSTEGNVTVTPRKRMCKPISGFFLPCQPLFMVFGTMKLVLLLRRL